MKWCFYHFPLRHTFTFHLYYYDFKKGRSKRETGKKLKIFVNTDKSRLYVP